MDVVYPEKAPSDRDEFFFFIEGNLDNIKAEAWERYWCHKDKVSFVTLNRIKEKFHKAAEKYGPEWQGLHNINTKKECEEEILDLIVYTAWDMLQQKFPPSTNDSNTEDTTV